VVQEVVLNQGMFDVAASVTAAQWASAPTPSAQAALLVVADKLGQAADTVRVEGGTIVLAAAGHSSHGKGAGASARNHDKVPPGDPCSKGNGNPCNGNNGNGGSQGNAGGPPAPPPPPPDATPPPPPPPHVPPGDPCAMGNGNPCNGNNGNGGQQGNANPPPPPTHPF
jgi:hypothetical protein